MIAIVDYGRGNLFSVQKAFAFLGAESCITGDAKQIMSADKVVLPGVGAFGDCMLTLKKTGLIPVLRDVSQKKPFLGICLGLQLMFEESEENPGIEGLSIFKGKIKKINAPQLKIPHMGWNKLSLRSSSPLLQEAGDEYVYFVHSFHAEPEDRSIITSVCDYGIEVTASVGRGKVQAFQFHPEKSSRVGMRLLKNFVEL